MRADGVGCVQPEDSLGDQSKLKAIIEEMIRVREFEAHIFIKHHFQQVTSNYESMG